MAIVRPNLSYIGERGVRDGSSPRESFSPNASEVVARFMVPFSERNNAATHFLGYSQLVFANGVPIALERLTPLKHPGAEFMVATAINSITHHKWQAKTLASGKSRNIFKKSEIEVKYEQVPYAVKEDNEITYEWERYVYVKSLKPGAEYLKSPGGMLQYVKEDGTPFGAIPFGTGIVVPITELQLTWIDVPFAIYSLPNPTPWQKRIWGEGSQTTRAWLGTINKTAMWGLPAGQVLFSNIEMEPKRSPTSGMVFDITFTFSIHTSPKGWNSAYFFKTSETFTPEGGTSPQTTPDSGWYYISSEKPPAYRTPGNVGDGQSIYCERDLIGSGESGLFHVGV